MKKTAIATSLLIMACISLIALSGSSDQGALFHQGV